MNRSQAIARLKAAEPLLRAKGIGRLYIFGSFARDEARADSDVDVLIEAANDTLFDLSNFTAAYRAIRDAFPDRDVSYATRDSLPGPIRATVEKEAVKVF